MNTRQLLIIITGWSKHLDEFLIIDTIAMINVEIYASQCESRAPWATQGTLT